MDRLEGAIRKEAKRIGLPASSPLVSLWPETVGETIAANAWPARLTRKGVLQVNTSSSTWAFELKHLETKILLRLRESLAEECPSELRFAPGPIPNRGRNTDSAEGAAVPQAGPAELAQAEKLAAAIGDADLRALVARAAAASLARRASK
jgi:predicted nucleic acid-binding Zn ribbon protein